MIEQTIRQKLPEGFQTAEFLLEHGFLDAVVSRKEMKGYIARSLDFFATVMNPLMNYERVRTLAVCARAGTWRSPPGASAEIRLEQYLHPCRAPRQPASRHTLHSHRWHQWQRLNRGDAGIDSASKWIAHRTVHIAPSGNASTNAFASTAKTFLTRNSRISGRG